MAAGASAGEDDDWRSIVGSEANLRTYLGGEGFRYCLNKTPDELAKEGKCVRACVWAGVGIWSIGVLDPLSVRTSYIRTRALFVLVIR